MILALELQFVDLYFPRLECASWLSGDWRELEGGVYDDGGRLDRSEFHFSRP